MKKISVLICVYLWLIFFCLSIAAQDYKTINYGIEYAEIKRGTEIEPIKINLLRLDLTKVRLDVVHALDAAIGLETTSSIATRHGAFAAINAGFFRLDKSIFAGDATGVLMIDGKLLSESYGNRIGLAIDNKNDLTEVGFDYFNLSYGVVIKKNLILLHGINRQRGEDEAILYSPEFHYTTLTDSNGLEIIIRNGKIKDIVSDKGSNLIPSDGFIISASGKIKQGLLSAAKIGEKIEILPTGARNDSDSQDKNSLGKIFYRRLPVTIDLDNADIVGGVPQLIKNGKIEITWEQEKSSKSFVETRHPRTAVAKLKDGKFLMITVDGRQKESVGMNLNELAALLLELGAVDAMNLDGGGSTTMFTGGKVVNKPSDKEGERKVSDVILVFPRKQR